MVYFWVSEQHCFFVCQQCSYSLSLIPNIIASGLLKGKDTIKHLLTLHDIHSSESFPWDSSSVCASIFTQGDLGEESIKKKEKNQYHNQETLYWIIMPIKEQQQRLYMCLLSHAVYTCLSATSCLIPRTIKVLFCQGLGETSWKLLRVAAALHSELYKAAMLFCGVR